MLASLGVTEITGERVPEPGRVEAPGQMPWFCNRGLEPHWARCCSCGSALQPFAGGLPALLTLREVSQMSKSPLFGPAPSQGTLSKSPLFPIGSDINSGPWHTLGQPPCSPALGALCPGTEAWSPTTYL